MGYNGYFKLGETEIINAARTEAYVERLSPSFGLQGCEDCDGLPAAVGAGRVYGDPERTEVLGTVTNMWRNPAPRNYAPTGFALYQPGTAEMGTTIYGNSGQSAVIRNNFLSNPYAGNAGSGWNFQHFSGEATTQTLSATDGPDPNYMNGYLRRTVTTAKTATGSSGNFYREMGTISGAPGQTRTFAAWVRFSVPTTVALQVQYRAGGAAAQTNTSPGVLVPANTWTLVTNTLTSTVVYDAVQIWPQVMQIMPVGATYDIGGALSEDPSTYQPRPFWTGSLAHLIAPTLPVTYDTAPGGFPSVRMRWGVQEDATLGGIPYFGRRIITTPKTGGDSGWRATAAGHRTAIGGLAGQTVAMSMYARLLMTPGAFYTLRMELYDGAGAVLQTLDDVVVVPETTEARLSLSLVATSDFASVGFFLFQTDGQIMPQFSVVDLGAILVSVDVAPDYPWFDGGSPDSLETEYTWTGAPSNSASVKTSYAVERPIVQEGGYTTPIVDRAPWLDSSNPDLTNFWGVYPLAVDGLDDSTRTTTVTELTTDGAVMSIPRARAREIRYDVMLVGADAAAIDAGFHWLNRALDAVRCDNLSLGCTGTDLNFFSTCPPLCDFSDCPDNPVDYNFFGINNLFAYEPAVTEAAKWQGSGGLAVRIQPFIGAANCDTMVAEFEQGQGIVSRLVTGLIVGETYLVTLDTPRTVPGQRLGVSGIGFVEAGAYVEFPNCDATMQYEFVATQNNHQVTLSMNPDHPAFVDTPATIQFINFIGLHVVRTSADRLTYQTYFPDDGSGTNGWTPNPSLTTGQGGSMSTSRQFSTLGVNWSAPNPGTSGPGVLVSRPMRGLVPGREYRFTISGYSSTATNLQFQAQIAGTVGGDIVTNGVTGRFAPYVDFIATSESATIQLYLVSTVTTGLSIQLNYASVVDKTVEPAPAPNPARRYERTLFQVTALTGPTITERFDKETGSMMRVTFGLVAGVPHHFGPMSRVGSAIGGTAFPIPEIDCSNFQPVRTNFITNPSMETNLTGWSNTWDGTAGTTTRIISPTAIGADEYPLTQRYVMRGAWTPSTTAAYVRRDTTIESAGAYVLSFYVRNTAPVTWDISIDARVGTAGNLISQSELVRVAVPANPTRWTRIEVPIMVGPGGATNLGITLIGRGAGLGPLPAGGGYYEMDGFQIEFGSDATDFFTGGYLNAAWTGTANASRSIYTPPVTSELIDPDCPPLPSPPAPPQITNACVEDPTNWTRYAINIPATDIPLFSSALPVVTISTGNVAARQVRMRWYRNPDNQVITSINPCDFEGEIIASYVPPFSEMEVNTITRTAEAVVDGGLPQVATQLLYGPDGGPMEWPELSCNIPYVFTVDVEPDGDVTNLDVRLELGLKV